MSDKQRRWKLGSPKDWPSLALLEFTVALARMMKARGDLKQKDVAEKLGVSAPYISSVMSGNENLTIEQMSRLAEAVGGALHVTIAEKGVRIKWVEDVLEVAPTETAMSTAQKMVPRVPLSYPGRAPYTILNIVTKWPAALREATANTTIAVLTHEEGVQLAGAQTPQPSFYEGGTYVH